MSNEIAVFNPAQPLTRSDLDNAQERRSLLREFVRSQMRPEVDFGVVPGTKSPSLFQPGAQKLAQLFGLGTRTELTHKEIDLHQNFAMFTYKAEVYHLATGTVISQCEGSANSQEKKYRTRTNYQTKSIEETPIGDVMNTLMKMAQKRAMVGAVIQATGASDFYTQDIDSAEDAASLGVRPAPQTTSAAVPNATSAKSTDQSQVDENTCPQCSGRMMISKYPNKQTNEHDWYCAKCKLSKPRAA